MPANAKPLPLSYRQAKCLAAIRRLTAEYNYPPCLQKIGAALGFRASSTGLVARTVEELRLRGLVEPRTRKQRDIRLTDLARELMR